MALDGIFLKKLTNELNTYIGAHIDKIYQPSHDELVFLLRGNFGAARLIMSARQGCVRVGITESKPENPQNPPMFCMLLRKYLNAAKLTDVQTDGLERVVTFTFSSLNEMGDVIYPKIVCEMISALSNIILVGDDNRIIDSVRRSDIEHSARLVQPGAKYVPVSSLNKINILSEDIEKITEKILKSEKLLNKELVNTLEGISPLVAREISYRITGDTEALTSQCSQDKLSLYLYQLKDEILNGENYCILFKDNIPFDFSFTDISQYGVSFEKEFYGSPSKVLDVFFTDKENAARIKKESQDIARLLTNIKNRTEKKLAIHLNDLEKCKSREQLRIYGELIKANLHTVKSGDYFVKTVNYYDENMSEIEIPLNPALNPQGNASHYFKEYKKCCNAAVTLNELIQKDKSDIEYINSVIFETESAKTVSEINDIREELRDSGYIKANNNIRKPKKEKNDFLSFISPDGFKVLVGRNNKENDYLSMKFSSKSDMWFHTKNIPGSHTVIISEGKEIPEATINFAAKLAAKHSKAALSQNVAVDYTLIKYVKKPIGAKAGMVIYTNNSTVFVTPDNM